MTYHEDEHTVPTYVLVAGKPKMKKADPDSRTFCKTPPAPLNAPPGSRVLTCQNVTMAEFAERLRNMPDETGLEGGWDLTPRTETDRQRIRLKCERVEATAKELTVPD